ncbi:MAG: virulence RhuM family protein [Patescibacteria group bacterium]|nr:virulence RhuM family protein [Patescibacteria group bacterium]
MKENNKIVFYQNEKGNVELRADVEQDIIWASQDRIAELFDTTKQNVGQHLKGIFQDCELDEKSVVKNFFTTASDGKKYKINHYNLDAIIAVGYRVNSKKATQFRIWATGVLRDYLKNGYSLNRYKLEKAPEALLDLYAAMSAIESKGLGGKLRGKVTFKMTQEMDLMK